MTPSRWALLGLAAALALLPTVQANQLRFEDPRGDQAPFPGYLDLLAVEFRDDGSHLAIAVQLAEHPPRSPSTVYDILFESSTQSHNVGCFLGATVPSEAPPAPSCFAYRSPRDSPLGPITDYPHARFAEDPANQTLRWSFPLSNLGEPAGEELRLVRVWARLGVDDERSGEIAAGDPQDVAATAEAYVVPAMAPPADRFRPEEAPAPEAGPADAGKDAPGLGPAVALLAVAAVAAARVRRRP